MVCMKPGVAIANVTIVIRAGDVALVALRTAARQFSDLAFRRLRVNLLSRGAKGERAQGRAEEYRRREESTERSLNLCPRVVIHATHAVDNETIA